MTLSLLLMAALAVAPAAAPKNAKPHGDAADPHAEALKTNDPHATAKKPSDHDADAAPKSATHQVPHNWYVLGGMLGASTLIGAVVTRLIPRRATAGV